MSDSESPDSELWFRYLDWSASQVGKRLAELSPAEVWQRAHGGAAQEPAREPRLLSPPSANLPSFYLELVQAATLAIARELQLPSFADWTDAYRRDPASYERDMLGIQPAAGDAFSTGPD